MSDATDGWAETGRATGGEDSAASEAGGAVGRSKSQRMQRSKSQRLRSKSQRLSLSKSESLAVFARRPSGKLKRPISGATRIEQETLVGQTFAERFEVSTLLRGDRLATTYMATIREEGEDEEQVALRVVHPHLSQREGFERSFMSWAAALCALEHERVESHRDCAADEEGQLYLVLDPCAETRSLGELLEESRPLEPERAVAIARQVLEALAAVHEAGLVHQQLTTECVRVGADDQVWLADFAVTSPDDAIGPDVVALDLTSARYASPELARLERQDERSDLYSLGLILYELLCGQPPFEGFFADQLLKARTEADPAPLAEQAPQASISPGLEAAVHKSLARDPNDRWQSAGDMLEALSETDEPALLAAGLPARQAPLDLVDWVSLPGLEGSTRVMVSQQEAGLQLVWLVDLPESPQRFLNAVERGMDRAAAVPAHSALAPMVAWGPRGDEEWVARSEWSKAPDAHSRIDEGPLSEAELIKIARPLLEGLGRAHQHGVSHGMIDGRLIQLTETGPKLHGLGVVPAIREVLATPPVDVRDLALVFLQLLAGVQLEDEGNDEVRRRGLARTSGVLQEVLEHASGDEPYRNAATMLEVLELDPRFRPLRWAPVVIGSLFGLLLILLGANALLGPADEHVVATTDADPHSSPASSPSANQTESRPSPSVDPSPTPEPTPLPSPEMLPTLPDVVPPSPEPPGPPTWFEELPSFARPAIPLPEGLTFGPEGEYLLDMDGSALVWIPPGVYLRGSSGFSPSEAPEHTVELTQGFFLGKHEVTWDQFIRFTRATEFQARRPGFRVSRSHPVHYVSWKEAQGYCSWAGGRLPTEAEWEYAASGAEGSRYPWGEDPPGPDLANLRGDADGRAHTSPVGAFPPGASPFGCLDMAGNVGEWVQDWYGPYLAGDQVDPTGPERGRARVVRGGGWFGLGWDCRTSSRARTDPRRRLDHVGFRIAVSPDE